jgi:hypothetical protein
LWMLRYQREHNRPPTACELAGFVTGRPSKRRPTSALCHLEALARRRVGAGVAGRPAARRGRVGRDARRVGAGLRGRVNHAADAGRGA